MTVEHVKEVTLLPVYNTFFDVGKDSEALSLDRFTRTEDIIVWESKEQYFEARLAEPKVIDGGIYTYELVAALSMVPDSLISTQIVSFQAPDSLLAMLEELDSVVHALRGADWPEWPE